MVMMPSKRHLAWSASRRCSAVSGAVYSGSVSYPITQGYSWWITSPGGSTTTNSTPLRDADS